MFYYSIIFFLPKTIHFIKTHILKQTIYCNGISNLTPIAHNYSKKINIRNQYPILQMFT
jgi:hypothetical protein